MSQRLRLFVTSHSNFTVFTLLVDNSFEFCDSLLALLDESLCMLDTEFSGFGHCDTAQSVLDGNRRDTYFGCDGSHISEL